MNYRGQDYYWLFQPFPEIREKAFDFSRYGIKGRINEKLVQSIWYDQRIKSDQLMLDDGRKVKILYPGRWNTEGGPDFKDAQLIISPNRKLKGDIEVHLLASHWITHKHQENRLYNNVILHICMWDDLQKSEKLQTPSGEKLLQLTLIRFLDSELKELSSLIDPQDYPYSAKSSLGACQSILSSLSLEQSGKLLDLAGEARMEEKVSRMAVQLRGKSYNQLLYEGIMEALGYKNNKEQFRQLAKKARLNLMKTLIMENEAVPTLKLIQSWLMGIAGFLSDEQNTRRDFNAKRNKHFDNLTALWQSFDSGFKMPPIQRDLWAKSQRPANLPVRRLVGMSHILARAKNLDLISYLYSAFEKEEIPLDRKGFIHINQRLKRKLISPHEDFWDRYYKPGGAALNHPVRTLGQSRAMVIIVNIIIPFFLLLARHRGDESLDMLLWHFYQAYPKLPENSMTRLIKYRLFGEDGGEGKIVSSASRQLGLMQIFKDFCSKSLEDCSRCDFVEILDQRKTMLL